MILEHTISQLDVGYVSDHVAERMGHLGFVQWLAGLDGDKGYVGEAMRAYAMAQPFIQTSPAIAVFSDLLIKSTAAPFKPLALKLPSPSRRGGAKTRRGVL